MAYGSYGNLVAQQFGGDFSRQTRYNVTLSLPIETDLKNQSDKFTPIFDVLAKSVELPPIQHTLLEAKYKGHTIPYLGRTHFGNTISITFYSDDTQYLRHVLDEWTRGLDDFVLGGSPLNFTVPQRLGALEVQSLDYDETVPVRKYQFYNVFPTSISGASFNSEAQGSIVEFTVEFTFSHFKTLEGEKSLANIFEEFKNEAVNKGISYLTGAGSEATGSLKKTTAAVIDVFE